MTWDITIPPTVPEDHPFFGVSQITRLAKALYDHPVPQPLADGTIQQASDLMRILRPEDEATIHVTGDAVQGVIDWWTFEFSSARKTDAPPLPHDDPAALSADDDEEVEEEVEESDDDGKPVKRTVKVKRKKAAPVHPHHRGRK